MLRRRWRYKPGRDIVSWQPAKDAADAEWDRWNRERLANWEEWDESRFGIREPHTPEVVAVLEAEAKRHARRARRRKLGPYVWGILGIVAIAIAMHLYALHIQRVQDRRMVNVYCSYSVVSEAQYQGCRAHVGASEIKKRHSRAARFAQGSLTACLDDSGPFCEGDPYAP